MITRYYETCDYTEVNGVSERWELEGLRLTSRYGRISVRSELGAGSLLADSGYRMTDRTIEVKLPLKNSRIDFAKQIRMRIEKTSCHNAGLFPLAERNFKEDSRFYVTYGKERDALSGKILRIWMDEMDEPFVCIYKDRPIGFLDVRFPEEYGGSPFVYLAAVEERYRLTGGAASLYAYACAYYKQQGMNRLYGRISSRNTAVMNLYASLGSQFLNPWDIFVK